MDKRANFNVIEIIVYMFFVIVVSIFIWSVAIDHINEKIYTINIETFLLSKRLMSSESCLAYKDNARVNPGVIDLQKLNYDRLTKCFSKKDFGYKISIIKLDNQIIKVASNLDLRQEAYLPICKDVKGFECSKRKTLVSLYNNGKLETGFMLIEVIKLA